MAPGPLRTRKGRFDTNNVEDLEYLHWVMPDEPLRALPLDIFMREYFTPGLLARLVNGQPLPAVRAVGDLNRAQRRCELHRSRHRVTIRVVST